MCFKTSDGPQFLTHNFEYFLMQSIQYVVSFTLKLHYSHLINKELNIYKYFLANSPNHLLF
jgi:hypothetical protein